MARLVCGFVARLVCGSTRLRLVRFTTLWCVVRVVCGSSGLWLVWFMARLIVSQSDDLCPLDVHYFIIFFSPQSKWFSAALSQSLLPLSHRQSVCHSVSRSVGRSVGRSVIQSVCRSSVGSVYRSVGQFVYRSIISSVDRSGPSVVRYVSVLVLWSTSRSVGQSVGR